MSIIERAMEKIRSDAATAKPAAAPPASESRPPPAIAPAIAPAMAPARKAVAPSLLITETMLADKGLRAPPAQLHQQSSEYRHVKRQLLAKIQLGSSQGNRLVLVSSALAGEGKTYTAVNLALSLALEPDYSVLLVDADVIKPNLSRLFELTEKQGLLDAAASSRIDVESLVLTTNIDGLSVLPAGTRHENATEHFASQRMQHVLAQLLQVPNRIVVVDSLPLLLTTEARVLLPYAGQVLLVVRAESTPRSAVLQALELIPEDVDAKLLLNAVVQNKLNDYYRYDNSYRYTYASAGTDGAPRG